MEFKGTKGEWFSCCKDSTPHFLFANDGEQTIASFNIKQDDGTSLPIEDVRANAELIEDAGNVRQKIDCSLPELLEQRNELLEVLELSFKMLNHLKCINSQCDGNGVIQTGEEDYEAIKERLKDFKNKYCS